MPPFMPEGEKARWRVIYDLLRPLAVGEVLTYAAMGEALDVDPAQHRHLLQMSARRALQELLNVDHRGADAVKNVGYRVAKPSEHVGLAERRNRSAGRQIQAGHTIATKVDLNGMEPATRSALETLARGFAMQAEINRRLAAKQAEHDELLEMLMGRVERLERNR